jgi:anti-anti-sigma factor
MDEVQAQADPGMTFSLAERDANTTVVTVCGELDISNVDELASAVSPVVQRGAGVLILDLNELEFADSSAIAIWVRWSSLVDGFHLRGARPLLKTVIERMGLSGKLGLER